MPAQTISTLQQKPKPDSENRNEDEIAIASFDYDAITEQELNIDEGDEFVILSSEDPEWFHVRRLVPLEDEPNEGFIPKSYCKYNHDLHDKLQAPAHIEISPSHMQEKKTLKQLVTNNITNHPKISSTQTLAAFGAMPSGFRQSTLSEYQQRKKEGKLSHAVLPVLSDTGILFKDMKMNTSTYEMEKVSTKCTLAFSVIEARNIPLMATGTNILGRYVNISLFDKAKIVGNVHSILAHVDVKSERHWKCAFGNASSSLFGSPGTSDNSCVVRVDEFGPDISVLFELVTVISRRISNDIHGIDIQHVSCGWGTLPMLGYDGKSLENKSYEIRLFGGTPFEKDIPLDDLIENIPSRSLWDTLRNKIRYPQLEIKVWQPSKNLLKDISHLPPTITFPVTAIRVLVQLRKIMYRQFVHERDTPSMNDFYSPSISLALKLMDELDLLKSFSFTWDRTWKSMKRSDKNDEEKSRKHFQDTISSFWPLLVMLDTPQYLNGHLGRLEDRSLILSQCLVDGPLKIFGMNPLKATFEPFDVKEISVSYLAQFNLACDSGNPRI